jgi:hypothetical protein
MGLDAFVRCTCVRDGKAAPHPLPDRFIFDETGEPAPTGKVSTEDWLVHDRWFAESCEHGGFLASESLGNITLAKHLREFLRGLQGEPGPRFPILLKKVVYDGTHTGDSVPSEEAAKLLQEVDTVLHSSDILSEPEKRFFTSMKRLCEASLASGNPIVF